VVDGEHDEQNQQPEEARMNELRINSARLGALLTSFLLTVGAANSLKAQVPAPPEVKKTNWEIVASAGLALTRGNSENLLVSAGINSSRKWSRDEIFLGANAGYGETTVRQAGPDEENTTQQYLKGFSQYNHLFTERIYGGLRLEGLYDKVAGVHYRFTISPMLGYYFVKNPATLLSAEVGPSLIIEEVRGPRVPDAPPSTNTHVRIDQNTYAAARVGQRFEHKFKSGAKIWETLEWIPQVNDFDNWLLNFEVGLSARITKKLDARLVLQDTYDNVPAGDRLKNDLKLIAGLGYKF
jgi:putative salt-induced outer membrane protein YdiY